LTAHLWLADDGFVAIAQQQHIGDIERLALSLGQAFDIQRRAFFYPVLLITGADHCIHE
jgi:hypothetical protein